MKYKQCNQKYEKKLREIFDKKRGNDQDFKMFIKFLDDNSVKFITF